MKYAYPQNPTHAVTAIKRLDESSDSSTSQSNLERPQDIAVVGETVPMIFCHRQDWGDEMGVNGGVWISPRLIQLGIKQTDLSMMYLLSQGSVTGLTVDNTFWGYTKLQEVDPDAQMCFAYESVPECLELDYEPGGSLGWTTTQVTSGPSLTGDSTYTFNTAGKVIKLEITFNSEIYVDGDAQVVGGYGGWFAIQKKNGTFGSFYDSLTDSEIDHSDNAIKGRTDSADSVSSGWNDTSDQNNLRDTYTKGGYTPSAKDSNTRYMEFNKKHKRKRWTQTSEVRYDWEVIDKLTNISVKSGQIWIQDGSSSLTIDDLPAGSYELKFKNLYKERDRNVPYNNITRPKTTQQLKNAWTKNYTNGPSSGFARNTYSGSETQEVVSTITQTIYNQIDFPDLPGGDQQIVGGLSDLTMMGIAGDITLLRPTEGPDYFLQSHVFIEQGIEVDRLLTEDVGPSSMYPDLVYYLMQKAQVLKPEQIDVDALTQACKLCDRYKLHFNGILQTTNSFAEWLTRTAPYFLLTPRQVDGKYGLWPVCPMNSAGELSRDPVQPVLTITADDIVAGSYSRSYISAYDKRPLCLIMIYRDQPDDSVGQTVTVEVRYPGTALSGPFESHDLTEMVCRAEQAVYAARYILAKRRFTTHTVEFTLGRRAAQLKPGDIVKVDLELSTTDGAGITDSIYYQLDSLQEDQGGAVAVSATHFPVDSDGVSVVAKETHEGAVTIQ